MGDSLWVDKVALVIGASSGIGRALAVRLAGEGARVVCAARSRAPLDALCAEIGRGAWAATVEVRERASVAQLVRDVVTREGRLDILYNGAGVGLLATIEDMTDEHWDRVLSTNLLGAVYGMQAAYPVMRAQRSGYIVNMSSLSGLLPTPASSAYAASKYGVVGLSHAARLEGAAHGVNVSVVCPAAVDTPIFVQEAFVNYDMQKVLAERPAGVLSADACARSILRGMRQNRATITPGPAGMLHFIYRHAPWLWELVARRFAKSLDGARAPGSVASSATVS